ncbi:MAG: hypothetical protein ABW352_03580 [Polyangiales bacterium]
MTCRPLSSALAALLLSSCGYVGIELRDVASDGGPDAPPNTPDARVDELDAHVGDAASSTPDAASLDASGEDATLPDAALADAQVDAQIDPGDAGGACDLTGSWAVKVSVPVDWSSPILEPSLGDAHVWLRYVGTQSGLSWTGTAQACGFSLPDFRLNPLVANESYAVRVPDTLFDRTYITPVATGMTIVGTSRVGDSFSLAPSAIVLGTELANPLTDAWPADRNALPNRDTDQDGRAGITIDYLNNAPYFYPPLNVTRTQRASNSYLAVRFAFQGSGRITSCAQLDGPISFSHFDMRILGCQLAGSSTQCDATLTDFLDLNRPIYTPNAATYEAIKVPANTTCAQIRATLPP